MKTSKILPGAALALAALAGLAYWAGSDSQQAQPQPFQAASDAATTAAAPSPAPVAPAAEPGPAADPPPA